MTLNSVWNWIRIQSVPQEHLLDLTSWLLGRLPEATSKFAARLAS